MFYYGIACVTCSPEVQAGIFNGNFNLLLLKLSIPIILAGAAVIYYSYGSGAGEHAGPPFPATPHHHAGPVIAFSLLLGLGMGGFTDGIVLHQILQWHQMISNIVPPVTLEAKNINMFWDGIFHAVTWTITLAGILLMWKAMKRKDLLLSGKLFAGGLVMGWGIFNLLDSLFNHYIFELHNVRENVENPTYWNLGFLLLSLLLMALGWILMQSGKKDHLSGTSSIT